MKKIWIILICAVILRLFLSFATFHPDIDALSKSSQFVSSGHILNLYDYSSDKLVLNYPPAIYLLFGIVNLIFSRNIPFFKLSYLPFDIFLGFLIYKLVGPKKSLLGFSFWMFNPINLYATYMMGQFDIIPTFFTVLSLYYALKNKLNLAALSLGGGVTFKLYPIFLIIPLIILGKSFWKKIQLLSLAALPYLLFFLPYSQSSNFRSNALFANQSSKSFYATIPVSGGESIILFPAFLLFFYLLIITRKFEGLSLWKVYSIPLLLFFIFTHFHPQWLIWITPFFILSLAVEKKSFLPIMLIFVSWILSLFLFDKSLTVGLFAPLFPILKNTSDIWSLFNIRLDYNFSRSFLQTIFASSAAYLIYHYFSSKEWLKQQ